MNLDEAFSSSVMIPFVTSARTLLLRTQKRKTIKSDNLSASNMRSSLERPIVKERLSLGCTPLFLENVSNPCMPEWHSHPLHSAGELNLNARGIRSYRSTYEIFSSSLCTLQSYGGITAQQKDDHRGLFSNQRNQSIAHSALVVMPGTCTTGGMRLRNISCWLR